MVDILLSFYQDTFITCPRIAKCCQKSSRRKAWCSSLPTGQTVLEQCCHAVNVWKETLWNLCERLWQRCSVTGRQSSLSLLKCQAEKEGSKDVIALRLHPEPFLALVIHPAFRSHLLCVESYVTRQQVACLQSTKHSQLHYHSFAIKNNDAFSGLHFDPVL